MMKNFSVGIGLLVALSSGAAFAASMNCADESQFKEIGKKELTTLVQKAQQKQVALQVVDVNSAESFSTNHIPTAIHYGDFKNDDAFVAALPSDHHEMIVAYCGGLQCTAWQAAAKAACAKGYTNIRHFKPGISGWMAGNQKFFETGNPNAPTATSKQ